MKKQLLISAFAVALSLSVKAQLLYNFSVATQSYAPLTTGISMNGATVWDDEDFQAPIGFSFVLNGDSITTFDLVKGAQAILGDSTVFPPMISGSILNSADLYDRGNFASVSSQSPIRYESTGTAPNRIFKAEVYNAGFYEEGAVYSTNDDSVSFQVWLHESSNIFEIHYGPSKISHFSDYYDPSLTGFFRNYDLIADTVSMFYYLKGNSSAPVMDSTKFPNNITTGLNSVPANGTVYRFTPKTLGVGDIAKINAFVYPVVCSKELMIENNEHESIRYTMLTMSGTAAASGNLQKGKHTIEVSSLASGAYILHLEGEGKTQSIRIIKN